LACALAATSPTAWADPVKKPEPAKKNEPAKKPSSPVTAEAAVDPASVLAASREAMKQLKAASYEAVVRVRASDQPTDTKDGTAHVVLSRADAGGWKMWIKGESLGLSMPKVEGEEAAKDPVPFQVGFDGAMAWSLRDSEQVLLEKTIRTPADLPAFFTTQLAGPFAAWNFLGDSPLELPKGAALTSQGVQTIDGTACDVVLMTLPAEPNQTHKGAPPSIAFSIARTDHLPRRIVRNGDARLVTLELKSIKLNTDAESGVFSMSPPDDYMVKSADQRRTTTARAGPSGNVGLPSNSGLLATGTQAPEWKLKDADGKEHKLSDYRGKVVLIDFWGSWCPPCRAAMPGVQELHEKYKDKGLAVLGVNYESNPSADPAKFMKDGGFTYQLLLHAETIAPDYKVPGWPTFYVLDREGKVLFGGVGFLPAVHEAMAKTIEKALGEGEIDKEGT
jgi:thiol-disulfide isomerase/thioredoxin